MKIPIFKWAVEHGADRYRDRVIDPSVSINLKRAWLVQCDYSQLENRIIALLSGDKLMLKLYEDGIDVHSYTASKFLGIDYDQFLKTRKGEYGLQEQAKANAYRDFSKTVRYGMHYMGTAETIWSQVIIKQPNIKLEDVRETCVSFAKMHPGILSYHHSNMDKAMRDDYLEAPISGRRLYMHGKPELTLIANWPMQTTGADIINAATVRWWEKRVQDIENGAAWRKYERIVAQVHDSIVVSTINPFGTIAELDEAMTKPVKLGEAELPFPIDAELGQHFGPDKENGGLRSELPKTHETMPNAPMDLSCPNAILDWALESAEIAGVAGV